MNARTWGACAVLLVLAGLVLPNGAAEGSQLRVQGTPVSLIGSHTTLVEPGAVHLQQEGEPHAFRVEADGLELAYAWKRGTAVEGAAGGELLGARTGDGESSPRFANASMTLEATEETAEILAFPGNGSPTIEAEGAGEHSFDRLDASHLTRVGRSPGSQDAGEMNTIGFWYQPAEDWMAASGGDRAVVEGNFSLFVNNVTVTVDEGGEAAWSNWTGYREDARAPGVHTYERHLLVVHVTGGRLEVAAEDDVTVLAPRLTVEVDGTVTAASATGRLHVTDVPVAFHNDPVWMEGNGRLHLTESETGIDGEEGLTMAVDARSSFSLEGGEPVESSSSRFPAPPDGRAAWGLVAGLAATGVLVGARRTGVGGQLVGRWRASRYTKWFTRGRELADARDYGPAATCFRRAARAQPAKGVAWYFLAITLLEDGRPREVLDVVDEAREGEAIIDELDFLELEAEAARRTDDEDRCREAVRRLAEGSEAMASTLARDLALDEDLLGDALAERLSVGEDDEELPGYV